MSKRGGVEVQEDGFLKNFFCGFNVVGDFADLVCRGAEIQLESDNGKDVCTTYCWCCCFWRGVLLGGVVGLVVGLVV